MPHSYWVRAPGLYPSALRASKKPSNCFESKRSVVMGLSLKKVTADTMLC